MPKALVVCQGSFSRQQFPLSRKATDIREPIFSQTKPLDGTNTDPYFVMQYGDPTGLQKKESQGKKYHKRH